ncbi:hypothetical protein FKM82_007118 [Ascaphus truei]
MGSSQTQEWIPDIYPSYCIGLRARANCLAPVTLLVRSRVSTECIFCFHSLLDSLQDCLTASRNRCTRHMFRRKTRLLPGVDIPALAFPLYTCKNVLP